MLANQVEDRTAETVQAILQLHILPFTEVHTDGGSCYKSIPFGHRCGAPGSSTKKTTTNPDTGKLMITYGGTITVESLWRNIKRRMWKIYNAVPETNFEKFT